MARHHGRLFLILAIILAGCAARPKAPSSDGLAAGTISPPPGLLICLNESVRPHMKGLTVPPGELYAAVWGDKVYGQWVIQPDGFKEPVDADGVRLVLAEMTGLKVSLAIMPVPVTCEWESDDGSDRLRRLYSGR